MAADSNTTSTFDVVITAAPTPVTGVTIAASPLMAGATTTITTTFTTSAGGALAAGDTVTVTLTGYTLTNGAIAVTPTLGFAGTLSGNVTGGNTVTVTLNVGASLAGSTQGRFTFAATNPGAGVIAAAGLTVATTNDTVAVPSGAAIVIAPATPVTGVTVAAAPTIAGGATTITTTFTTSAGGALAAGDRVTVVVTGYALTNGAIAVTPTLGFAGTLSGNVTGGNTVTVTLNGGASLAGSTQGRFTFAATNPGAGTLAAAGLTVATTKDTVAVQSGAAIVITGATSVSGVTVAASPTTPASAATITTTFTPSAGGALAAADTITVVVTGYALTNGAIAVTPTAGFAGTLSGNVSGGNTVTVTLNGGASLAGSTQGKFTFAATNPGAGTLAAAGLTVVTSKDTVAVQSSAAIVIASPVVTSAPEGDSSTNVPDPELSSLSLATDASGSGARITVPLTTGRYGYTVKVESGKAYWIFATTADGIVTVRPSTGPLRAGSTASIDVQHRTIRWVVSTYSVTLTGPAGEREACSPGFFSADGKSPCPAVPAGAYQPNYGATGYLQCGAGTWSAEGAAQCTKAGLGRFARSDNNYATGPTRAELCPRGYYADEEGLEFCKPAPIGSYVSTLGAIAPSKCPAGTTTTVEAATECVSSTPKLTGASVTPPSTAARSTGDITVTFTTPVEIPAGARIRVGRNGLGLADPFGRATLTAPATAAQTAPLSDTDPAVIALTTTVAIPVGTVTFTMAGRAPGAQPALETVAITVTAADETVLASTTEGKMPEIVAVPAATKLAIKLSGTQTGSGTTADPIKLAWATTTGSSAKLGLNVEAQRADGTVDESYKDLLWVAIDLAPGGAGFTGTGTYMWGRDQSAKAGVASFEVAFNRPGTYTLYATDHYGPGTTARLTESGSITIVVAAPAMEIRGNTDVPGAEVKLNLTLVTQASITVGQTVTVNLPGFTRGTANLAVSVGQGSGLTFENGVLSFRLSGTTSIGPLGVEVTGLRNPTTTVAKEQISASAPENTFANPTADYVVVKQQCGPGTYSIAGDGYVPCQAAPKGWYVAGPGDAAIQCKVGSYSDKEGAISCKTAEPGFYVDSIGADHQTACPAGMTSLAGSKSTEDCYRRPYLEFAQSALTVGVKTSFALSVTAKNGDGTTPSNGGLPVLSIKSGPAGGTIAGTAGTSEGLQTSWGQVTLSAPGAYILQATSTAFATAEIAVTVKAPPVVTAPQNIEVDGNSLGGAVVTYTASATDGVDGVLPVSCTPPSGSLFPVGATVVSCRATNAAGFATEVRFTVTVKQTAAPTLLGVPKDATYEGNVLYGVRVTFGVMTASDIVDGALPVSCTHASGSLFIVGATKVTCSAVNSAGLSAAESFTVTVTDTIAPTLQGVPSSFTVEGTATDGATVTYTLPTATDVVDPAPLVVCSRRSGSTLPVGTHTVTCTATDASNNSSQASSFTVTVVPERTLPLRGMNQVAGMPDELRIPLLSLEQPIRAGGSITFTLPGFTRGTAPLEVRVVIRSSSFVKTGTPTFASGTLTVPVEEDVSDLTADFIIKGLVNPLATVKATAISASTGSVTWKRASDDYTITPRVLFELDDNTAGVDTRMKVTFTTPALLTLESTFSITVGGYTLDSTSVRAEKNVPSDLPLSGRLAGPQRLWIDVGRIGNGDSVVPAGTEISLSFPVTNPGVGTIAASSLSVTVGGQALYSTNSLVIATPLAKDLTYTFGSYASNTDTSVLVTFTLLRDVPVGEQLRLRLKGPQWIEAFPRQSGGWSETGEAPWKTLEVTYSRSDDAYLITAEVTLPANAKVMVRDFVNSGAAKVYAVTDLTLTGGNRKSPVKAVAGFEIKDPAVKDVSFSLEDSAAGAATNLVVTFTSLRNVQQGVTYDIAVPADFQVTGSAALGGSTSTTKTAADGSQVVQVLITGLRAPQPYSVTIKVPVTNSATARTVSASTMKVGFGTDEPVAATKDVAITDTATFSTSNTLAGAESRLTVTFTLNAPAQTLKIALPGFAVSDDGQAMLTSPDDSRMGFSSTFQQNVLTLSLSGSVQGTWTFRRSVTNPIVNVAATALTVTPGGAAAMRAKDGLAFDAQPIFSTSNETGGMSSTLDVTFRITQDADLVLIGLPGFDVPNDPKDPEGQTLKTALLLQKPDASLPAAYGFRPKVAGGTLAIGWEGGRIPAGTWRFSLGVTNPVAPVAASALTVSSDNNQTKRAAKVGLTFTTPPTFATTSGTAGATSTLTVTFVTTKPVTTSDRVLISLPGFTIPTLGTVTIGGVAVDPSYVDNVLTLVPKTSDLSAGAQILTLAGVTNPMADVPATSLTVETRSPGAVLDAAASATKGLTFACGTDQFRSARNCLALTTCNAAQYQSVAPSPTNDRQCRTISTCTDAEYQVSAPTLITDRVCGAITVCPDGSYEVTPPTSFTDRVCASGGLTSVTLYQGANGTGVSLQIKDTPGSALSPTLLTFRPASLVAVWGEGTILMGVSEGPAFDTTTRRNSDINPNVAVSLGVLGSSTVYRIDIGPSAFYIKTPL